MLKEQASKMKRQHIGLFNTVEKLFRVLNSKEAANEIN